MKQEKQVEYFKIELAEKNVEIECIHRQVFHMCRDYLAKFDTPDFVVEQSQEAIEFEREESGKEYTREGKKPVDYSDSYLETLAVYRKIADYMMDYGVILMHAAAIAVDDSCYLFLAKSGVGKTTQIRNWLKVIDGSYVVNGDKPLINVEKRLVYGTPWCGKENMNTNTSVTLAGICILERADADEDSSIKKMQLADVLPKLMQQIYRPQDAEGTRKVLELVSELKDVPFYKLRCDNRKPESALMAYEYMHKA